MLRSSAATRRLRRPFATPHFLSHAAGSDAKDSTNNAFVPAVQVFEAPAGLAARLGASPHKANGLRVAGLAARLGASPHKANGLATRRHCYYIGHMIHGIGHIHSPVSSLS